MTEKTSSPFPLRCRLGFHPDAKKQFYVFGHVVKACLACGTEWGFKATGPLPWQGSLVKLGRNK